MKIITLTLLLCFTITICQSQSFKIGKVDKEEFTTSEEILEGAIYLEKYRETFFEYDGDKGWILITEIKERIKITSMKKAFASLLPRKKSEQPKKTSKCAKPNILC